MTQTTQQIIDSVGKTFAFFLSFVAVTKAVGAIAAGIKKRRDAKQAKHNEQMDMLRKLCTGQNELDARMCTIEHRLTTMDRERHEVRREDAKLRANLYLGTVAIVDSVMRLAEHQGLIINGEVAAYRAANLDYLKNGVGMAPLHADAETLEG